MNKDLTLEIVRGAVNKLVDFVKPTYGPKGRKVIIANGVTTLVLDDGASIAREFHLDDPTEESIISLVKETASKTNQRVGDGTTGSLILLQAIMENIGVETNLRPALAEACEMLRSKAQKVESLEALTDVARMAYNNNEVATMIGELVHKLGSEAVITLEESPSLTIQSDVITGLQLDSGYVSPYMITTEDWEAVWEKSAVLVTERKILGGVDLIPLIERLQKQQQTQLVIFGEDFMGDTVQTLVNNKLKGGFKILAVKAPGYGERKREFLYDIAACVGGEVLVAGDYDKAVLGFADKVIAGKDSTTILASGDVAKRVSQLQAQLEKDPDGYDKEMLQKRIARLGDGIGIIKVGASTSSEMKAIKYKIEDAINATKVAARSGVVRGAGLELAELVTSSDVLNTALKAPRKALWGNGVLSETFDPVEVLIASLESAVSIAMLLVESSGVISEYDKNPRTN